jgi:hypothetical protein
VTEPRRDKVVEVFHPRQAPHLVGIAAGIAEAFAAALDRALPDRPSVERFANAVADDAANRAAWARFRAAWFAKIGIKPTEGV